MPGDDEDDGDEEEGEGGVSAKKRKKKPSPDEGGGDDSVDVKPVVPIQYRAFALNADAGVYSVSVTPESAPAGPVMIAVGAVGDDQRIGVEVRSARVAGGAELKQRSSEAATMVAVEQIIPNLKTEIARLFAESQQRVVPVSFPE